MRTKYLFAFSAVVAALLLPCAARAQECSDCYGESFGTYDSNSNIISGYSRYTEYCGDWYLSLESYLSDPSGNYDHLGGSAGYGEAEVDFSYIPARSGSYTVWGINYIQIESWWEYDTTSDYDVWVNGPPPPVITTCPSPAWGIGNFSETIMGSGFWGTLPTISDGGAGFLQSGSGASVVSDSQISLYVVLGPRSSSGWVTITDGLAVCAIPVAAALPPPDPVTISYQGAIIATSAPGTICVFPKCSVVVGQQVTLTGFPSGGSWSIGGTRYQQWLHAGQQPTPVDTSSATASFFWVTRGNFTATYSANNTQASASFSVDAPLLTGFVPQPTTAYIDPTTLRLKAAFAVNRVGFSPPVSPQGSEIQGNAGWTGDTPLVLGQVESHRSTSMTFQA